MSEVGILQTTALLIEDPCLKAIYAMRNPDKLRHCVRMQMVGGISCWPLDPVAIDFLKWPGRPKPRCAEH